MNFCILLALLAAHQPAEQEKQVAAQQQEQKIACSTCQAEQTQTRLTPEATTLCQECFERMKKHELF